MTARAATDAFAAVEALFGAGVVVSPMQGATLLRHPRELQDGWAGGLHVDEAPRTVDEARAWISSWDAFERPGRLRWFVPHEHDEVCDEVNSAIAAGGLAHESRAIVELKVPPPLGAGPDALVVQRCVDNPYDWAGFETLARWVDRRETPAQWTARARRVRNLVEAGRGGAWLGRIDGTPVAAAVAMPGPDHRDGSPGVVAVVVHQARRGAGVARALIAAAMADCAPTMVLGHLGVAVRAEQIAVRAEITGRLVEIGPSAGARPPVRS